MCTKTPKIQKADPVIAAPPPPQIVQKSPVLNEASKAAASDGSASNILRRGRKSLVIPLNNTSATGVNIPQ